MATLNDPRYDGADVRIGDILQLRETRDVGKE